jgi:hypothetical protein
MSALLEKCFSRIFGKYVLFNGSPDPLFIIFLVVICIALIKVVSVSKKNTFSSTSPVGKWVLSTLGIVCNFMFSQQGHFVVECMEDSPTNNNNNGGERGKGKEPLEHEGVPPELKSRDDLIEVPLSPAEQGARSTPTTGPSADPGEGEPSNAPLRRGQPEGGSALPRQLTPADLAHIHDLLFNTYPDIEQQIREIHGELRTRPVGAFQAERLVEMLESRYGAERMPEILRDMQSFRQNSPYFRETLTDLRHLRASGEGTEAHLRRDDWIHPQGKR